MARPYVRDPVPLSRFGVLVAQLESIVASAAQKPPEPLLCFDLLSHLLSSIDEETKDSLLLWQRKCEDAIYSLLILGARRPVRHLASMAMARIIYKGDSISIYSRISSLQGFLSDAKKSESHGLAGAAQCLGELYRHFGGKITSGLLETTMIATKLMKFNEDFVRQEALHMLQNALEGCGGGASSSAYAEAYRLITRFAVGDKSFVVRIAAARCLKAFANIGGPGLGVGELDSSASYCVKALEDPLPSVRDAFSEALASVLALGVNPEAQVQPKGKGHFPPAKKIEGGLQKHLALPFTKAKVRLKDVRIGVTLSWVFFLQAIHLKYLQTDSELQNYALQVIDMLREDTIDAHALACVLYILRVGVTDQMTEPNQRSFLVLIANKLQSPDGTPSMKIAVLRTLSYILKTLEEVPSEFKEVLDNTVVGAVSHSSPLVRIEAALTLRALAEVDPTCVGGLISYGVTTLSALRENVSFEKGSNLKLELDNLHGQATILAALVSISPKLSLGYPARLPKSVFEVSKKMLSEPSRNPVVVTIEEEAGWLLLSSLLASMPKEELEDQVFDILSLWAAIFSRDPEREINKNGDLTTRINVWSAAVDALTAFIKCFISPGAVNDGVLLQPVLVYLSRVLSCISALVSRALPNTKSAVNILIIRTLIAYQSLPNPMAYKNDHPQIIQLCSTPFRDASGCEESTCLRLLLDKRDAWLGPWTPGRDWFEDELRAFEGGKDGLMSCVWENELSIFPQPDSINKTLVNQKLLCFAIMFASQDSSGMLSLLGMIEQCLKAGKRQQWHAASVTNICVGLLAGLKYLLALRPQPLGKEILSLAQSIFQSILAEGDICASQRRASAEGLGLLARLGNDIFTARMTRSLLSDLNGVKVIDPNYAGSVSVALGCIHRSAGGMALATLVPATVRSLASLAKSSIAGLQVWSLHGLLLTIEAAGLSFVSHVQAMLGLALEILLSENGWVDVQQGVARLINAIVAVLGPELAPDSIFFSRCKSIVAEISTWPETVTMLESARFTQQLVLFAPQAVSVHSHVQTLLPTLSSRQPALRHLAISTLRHLIEKDAVSVINEQIEDNLFRMLDEETDSEIGNLIRATIMRLLYASCPSCPSHWMSVCRNMVLATSTRRNAETNMNLENDSINGDSELNFGEDDETMVSSSRGTTLGQGHTFDAFGIRPNRDKHLRYRTRVFAAECLSHLPSAVGSHPAHFDLSLASKQMGNAQGPGHWLVLHLQELIGLAYQISTIQFENMQPIGVGLLSTIIDKFETVPDPELPGHLLLEQYQAQLVSAVRSALGTSSSPILLESGLQLATKILMSGMISGDQVAVKRIFSLISRPLNDFNDLYYPSFAEWVACKIKIRLLAAHASLKCYIYSFLRRHDQGVTNEHQALLPLFSENSNILGKYWIQILKDLSYICLGVSLKRTRNPFLDEIHSAVVFSKLGSCLEEAWPVMLQALALDAVPLHPENMSGDRLVSGYGMVKLESDEYRFLWGFALLVLFQGQHPSLSKQIIPSLPSFKLRDTLLPVFQFLSSERFFSVGYLTVDSCQELFQVFSYFIYMDNQWGNLVISVISQIVENCPEDFLVTESFAHLSMELCLSYLFKLLNGSDAISPDHPNWEELISPLFIIAKTLARRFEEKKQLHTVILAFLSVGYKGIRVASTKLCFSKVNEFLKTTEPLLKKLVDDKSTLSDDGLLNLRNLLVICLNVAGDLTKDCIEGIHLLGNKRSDLRKLLQTKLAFSLEETISFAELAHKIGSFGENNNKLIFFSMVKYCAKWIQTTLADSSVQVQAIGLQVLESLVQRDTNTDDNTYLMFFIGEVVGNIFTIIQKVLKGHITKESVVIAGECLRILLLLHKQSKSGESQKQFMNLLLEAIVMVFSASEDVLSQGVKDIRSTAIKLVTLLAQIPSSAAQFKDVLLSMPVAHRQQLQGIIRASVTQDHGSGPTQAKAVTPISPSSFQIKFPLPTGASPKNNHPPLQLQPEPAKEESDQKSGNEEGSEGDEDDWDTFQSFPATTTATTSGGEGGTESKVEVSVVADEPDPDENSELDAAGYHNVGEEIEDGEEDSAKNTSLEDAEQLSKVQKISFQK